MAKVTEMTKNIKFYKALSVEDESVTTDKKAVQ